MSKIPSKTKDGRLSSRRIRKPGSSGAVNVYVYGRDFSSSRMIELIEEGLPIRELNDLRSTLDVDMEKLATMLGISKATLHRRKAEGRLEPAESDRVLRFARLIGKAVTVLGGIDAARQWLNSSQPGLGGAVPLDYAGTELGAREVENLLGRIEYGVYS